MATTIRGAPTGVLDGWEPTRRRAARRCGSPARGAGMGAPARPRPRRPNVRYSLREVSGMKVRIAGAATAAAAAALAAPGIAHGATLAAQGACFVQGANVPVVGAQWLPGS